MAALLLWMVFIFCHAHKQFLLQRNSVLFTYLRKFEMFWGFLYLSLQKQNLPFTPLIGTNIMKSHKCYILYYTHLHIGGQCIGVCSFDFLDGTVCLLLIAAGQNDIISSLTQVSGHLITQARVGACHDNHTTRHTALVNGWTWLSETPHHQTHIKNKIPRGYGMDQSGKWTQSAMARIQITKHVIILSICNTEFPLSPWKKWQF